MLRGLSPKHVEVWDMQAGKTSWDAAARTGGLGADNVDIRNYDALRTAIWLAKQIEESLSARMGRKSPEREMERVYFEEAMEEVVREEFGKPDSERGGSVVQESPRRMCETVNDCIGREVLMYDSEPMVGSPPTTLLPIENLLSRD